MNLNINKVKFVVFTSVLFMLPFGVLSYHFMNVSKSIARGNQSEKVALRVKTVSKLSADFLFSRYKFIEKVKSGGFKRWKIGKQKKYLEEEIRRNNRDYKGFAVFNGRKKVFDVENLNVEKSILDKVLRSSLSMGSVEFSQEEPPALIIAEPLFSGKSTKKIILCAKIDLSPLADLVRNYNMGGRGEIGIIDAGGQIIADSVGRSIMKPGVKVSAQIISNIEKAVNKGKSFSYSYLRLKEHKDNLIVIANIHGSQWWVYEISNFTGYDYYSKWAKKVVWKGIILIFVFGFISLKFAEFWVSGKVGPSA